MSDSAFIRRVRRKLGFTQKEFAAYLNVGERTLIRWENGGPVPHRVRLLINMLWQKERNRVTT